MRPEARKSYLSLSQETDDPELKTLLKEIAMEEASHEASLRSRLRLYQERHVLRDTFSRYVSPELCEEILKNPGLLALGGRRQQVTVLFADIRNFTSMSEAMAPEAVVEVLNTYFTEMVDLVFKYQGTLDKFVGDALMAVFGVPLPLPQAATRAVECALAMQRHLRQMQSRGPDPHSGHAHRHQHRGGHRGQHRLPQAHGLHGGGGRGQRGGPAPGTGQRGGSRHPDQRGHLPGTGRAVSATPEPAVVLRGRKEPTATYRLKV